MVSFTDLLYHATLEKRLLEYFPLDVFQELQLPESTYPTIYQGLPRYSKPLYPKHLFVKEEFSNLAILKKRCIDKALLYLYHEAHLTKAHTIVLFTYVIPGGLGDYFAQQRVKEHLLIAFPHLHIHTISLIHVTAPLTFVRQDSFNHIIYFSSQDTLMPTAFPKHLLHLLRNAALILQIPTLYPHWTLLLTILTGIASSSSMPATETIGEYGFICSPHFYPSTDTRCLGLHVLEHGVLLDNTLPPGMQSLKDQQLLALILNNRSFSSYHKTHHFYFAYLYTEKAHILYLYTLLLYLAQDSKDIDLCTPDIGLFLKALSHNIELLSSAGIKEFHIFYKHQFSKIHIASEGKIVRIIHTGPLDHLAFKTLLYASKEPVGIRGNLSLSEAISLNKVYFYDVLEHNTTLYYGLIAMAESLHPHAKELLKLYNNHEEVSDSAKKLSKIMLSTPALEELRDLGRNIQKNYNALPHLQHLILKTLKHKEEPTLQKKESLLIEAFSRGTLSLKETLLRVNSSLKTD